MTASSKLACLPKSIREFISARGANVTVTFALAIIPVAGTVGAAVDYSNANSVKTAMQAASDSTALMLSRDASSLTNAQIQAKADSYFKALFNRPEATGLQVVATYTSNDGSQIKIKATSNVKTNFMGIMGITFMKVGVESQVKWGNTRLRVALALDVTGSMASAGKMTALKTAAKGFLKQLQNAASKNGDVYVSIVPFNKDVNVGKTNVNEKWIRWDEWEEVNGKCNPEKDDKNQTLATKSACESYKSSSSPGNSQGKGKGKGGTSTSVQGQWTPSNKSTWQGCVMDRDIKDSQGKTVDYDAANTAPDTSNSNSANSVATRFPAEQYKDCPTQLMALTYDWKALTSKIDSLNSVGMTNQTIGLQWAFQSLTSAPFVIPPKEANYQYTDVIILMTDGDNTQSRHSSNKSQIDARTSKTCENIKNFKNGNQQPIVLYTIQVNTDGTPTQEFLRSCATSKDKFFLLTSANQMVSTFQSIGTALSNLRVAK